MVRAILGPLRLPTKGDPEHYVAIPTRGVPQGAPSFPLMFNMYFDCLATYTEAIQCIGQNGGAVTMISDDVFLHAKLQDGLQQLLARAERWQTEREASWSVGK